MDTSISSFPPLVYAYLKQVSKPDEEIKYRAVYIIETLIVDVGCRSQQCQRLKPESKVSNYKTRLKYYVVRSHVFLTLILKQHSRNGDEMKMKMKTLDVGRVEDFGH